MALTKQERRYRIKKRVRKVVNGTTEAPRMSVFRSNKHIAVQIIDDVTGKTLVSASSLAKDMADKKMKKIDKINQSKLSLNSKFEELGLDSLDQVELV